MQPTLENSSFPVFEANQVLSNRHLNQLFNYTDEQERLTRANLIGIGIACGLEIRLGGTAAAPEILVGRGCGVTSEGYLIVEPKDLTLVSYKTYTLPIEVDYPLLRGMPVWEMFEEGEPDAIPFAGDPTFLHNKVALLFLELKKESLRNCSPTNCDDRGAEVVVTVRRLLVSQSEEQRVIRLLDGTVDPTGLTLNKYEEELMRALNLPDIRLPRYSVPAGPLASSNSVLAGFFSALKTANLATRLGNALSACYHAFQPVVQDLYPTDPSQLFLAGDTGPHQRLTVGRLRVLAARPGEQHESDGRRDRAMHGGSFLLARVRAGPGGAQVARRASNRSNSPAALAPIRAVASACGANPLPLVIPCHRVVAKDGTLGGFSLGGLAVKETLLALEAPKAETDAAAA